VRAETSLPEIHPPREATAQPKHRNPDGDQAPPPSNRVTTAPAEPAFTRPRRMPKARGPAAGWIQGAMIIAPITTRGRCWPATPTPVLAIQGWEPRLKAR